MWGAVIGAGINAVASHLTAAQNNKYAVDAAERNYGYSLQYHSQAPKYQREGLEAAGYNPLLALGNIGSGSYSGTSQAAKMDVPDLVGGAKAASKMVQDILKSYKLQNKKTEKEIENLESDLTTKETQRLQTEANTSLALSQTDRTDLAYGRDIADSVMDAVGTAGGIYGGVQSAKMAKEVAQMRRDATYGTHTTQTVHPNGKQTTTTKKLTPTKSAPVAPTVKSTPKHIPAKNSIPSALRHSAKAAIDTAKAMGLPASAAAAVGAAAFSAYGTKEARDRTAKHYERAYKDKPYSFSPLR